ncbi:MAG: hypothetical protein FRX49_07730 [Trebouxia sp. A1-2]|nr:MAG: hypothetical protein FRX49_07730 [Trebouxia sp. A1-2]
MFHQFGKNLKQLAACAVRGHQRGLAFRHGAVKPAASSAMVLPSLSIPVSIPKSSGMPDRTASRSKVEASPCTSLPSVFLFLLPLPAAYATPIALAFALLFLTRANDPLFFDAAPQSVMIAVLLSVPPVLVTGA